MAGLGNPKLGLRGGSCQMPRVIKLKDAAQHFKLQGEQMVKAAQRGLLKAGERGVQKIVVEIIPSRSPQPVDRGVYKAGWKTERIDANTVAIFNPESHAVFIEFGVRAENVKIGMALIRSLSEWVLRKGMAEDDKKAASIAWAIAMKMQRVGIFNKRQGGGLRVLEELNNEHIDAICKEEIEHELRRVVSRF